MGWTFRRSARFGPLRINFSRSGVGYSIGAGGFRTGIRANGRRYTSVNVPSTGITYRTSSTQSQHAGCAVALMVGAGFTVLAADLIARLA
jgi:hypothetical protein